VLEDLALDPEDGTAEESVVLQVVKVVSVNSSTDGRFTRKTHHDLDRPVRDISPGELDKTKDVCLEPCVL
jgi:hypothetical protein